MVYRAKITKIQAWVEDHYNTNLYNLVKDAKDVYIEVGNEEEAYLLEVINKKTKELIDLKNKLTELYATEE